MIEVRSATGPIRIRVTSDEKVAVKIASVPVGVRLLGTPGPDGRQGERGIPGRDGIATLPEDTVINGGFF